MVNYFMEIVILFEVLLHASSYSEMPVRDTNRPENTEAQLCFGMTQKKEGACSDVDPPSAAVFSLP